MDYEYRQRVYDSEILLQSGLHESAEQRVVDDTWTLSIVDQVASQFQGVETVGAISVYAVE